MTTRSGGSSLAFWPAEPSDRLDLVTGPRTVGSPHRARSRMRPASPGPTSPFAKDHDMSAIAPFAASSFAPEERQQPGRPPRRPPPGPPGGGGGARVRPPRAADGAPRGAPPRRAAGDPEAGRALGL